MFTYNKNFKCSIMVTMILICSFLNTWFINETQASVNARRITTQTGGERIVLENEHLYMEIDPDYGARASNFTIKKTNKQIVISGFGMFIDHFWQQLWPGEFFNAGYKVTILNAGPDVASIKAERVSEGGNNKEITQKDILLERIITLKEGSEIVEVTVKLTNMGQSGKLFGYWVQHVFYPAGVREEPVLNFRPASRGISEGSYDISKANRNEGEDFVRDPQSPWIATISKISNSGLVFVMQYDWLRFLYNSKPSLTTEWQYDRVGLPEGKSWQTTYWCYPISGFERIDYASKVLVAEIKPLDVDNKLNINLKLAAADFPIKDVDITGEIEGLIHDKVKRPLTGINVKEINRDGATYSFNVSRPIQDPVIIRLKIKGVCDNQQFTETFETYFGSKYGENRKVDNSPLYILPKPERYREFLKPDKIVKKQNIKPRILFCKGLFADDYISKKTFEHINAEVVVSYLSAGGVFGAGLSLFPVSYDEIMSYDVIILVNIDFEAIGEFGTEMLKDFVYHGGVILYVGDFFGFDRGRIAEFGFDKVLPIEKDPHTKISFVNYLSSITTGSELKEISFSSKSEVTYMIEGVELLPDAKIELSAGKIPLVVSKNIGEGKIIVVLGTALGEAKKGNILFTDDPAWSKALDLLIGKK